MIYLVPNSDTDAGFWTTTPLWSKVNEASENDSPFISSRDNNNDVAVLGIAGVTTPQNTTATVRVRYRKNESGGHAINLAFRILENGTERYATTFNNIGATFVTAELTVDLSAVTDWNNLHFEVGRTGETGGAPGSRRSVEVSWIRGELPGNIPEGGGDAIVEILAEGGGEKIGTGGADFIVNISTEGGGGKLADGGGESAISINAEGGGFKSFSSGGDSSPIIISATGGGVNVANIVQNRIKIGTGAEKLLIGSGEEKLEIKLWL